jgi:hypothetical protein
LPGANREQGYGTALSYCQVKLRILYRLLSLAAVAPISEWRFRRKRPALRDVQAVYLNTENDVTRKELKQALKALKWSQAELSRRIETYPTTLSRWLLEDRIPGAVAAYVNLALEVRKMADLTNPAPRR